ncbi:MAG: hypothetical protein Q9227_006068 [Pyrenula ochraceoflavens]
MCRWFAYVSSTEECLLEDVLIRPAHSLSKQVHDHYLPKLMSHDPDNITTEHEISVRNRLFNVDGFGVTWYSSARDDFGQCKGKRPALYKNSQPPTNDGNFHSICAQTSTTACFAHIRAATATSITPVNNHPFVFGRHTIMHNGVIANFLDIKRDMVDLIEDDAYANISGSTDSEHLSALYITYLTQKCQTGKKGAAAWEDEYPVKAMSEALGKAIASVVSLQRKKLGSSKMQANSLNVAVTDGEQLVAYRFRNHIMEQPPSLYWSNSAGQSSITRLKGVTLNRKYPDEPDGSKNLAAYKNPEDHGSHVIVASEPSTYKREEWNLIPKNHSLEVNDNGEVKVRKLDVTQDMLASST